MHPSFSIKRFHIKTYGCQMNFYDSERMAAAFAERGIAPSDDMQEADIIILNTCHIREKAAEKIYSELGRIRALKEKEKRGDAIVAVAGCVAQAEGEEIIRRAPLVDLLVGPQNIQDLPHMVDEYLRSGEKQIRLEFPAQEKFSALRTQIPSIGKNKIIARSPSAFLTIQEGCDKFCSFCVVPYTRGGEVSRRADEIIAEARALVEAGVREITLLGQNVNAWKCPQEKIGLAALLARLADIEALARLRFTTSHACDMDEALIAAFGENEKLMPYLHLPLQSGADKILKAMNRKHSVEDYLDIIARVRAVRPDLALSSDFIVGFPDESEEDFCETLSVVEQLGYASAFSFKYSPRPGTPAASKAQLPEEVKSERLQRLQDMLKAQQRAFNHALVGETLPVLFEKTNQETRQISGRSPYLQHVHVPLDDLDAGSSVKPEAIYGTICAVAIQSAGDNSLRGNLLFEAAK